MTFAEIYKVDYTGQTYNGVIKYNKKDLTSLVGMPHYVKGNVNLEKTSITNLIGSPTQVSGDFVLYNCMKLKSLEGGPKLISGTLYISNMSTEDAIKDIVKYNIKANRYNIFKYNTFNDIFEYSDLADAINSYVPIEKRVSRPSMRTLLGLDK